MAKPEQVLIIEPQHELKFTGPFTSPVTSYMKLTNPSNRKVLFKIKTTAPKKYCVRPNSGVLLPNKDTELAICLQPFIYNSNEKNKHKFMVQSTYLETDSEEVNLEQVWKEITPEQLMDSKLKCVFEIPPHPANESGEEPAKAVNKLPLTSAVNTSTVGSPNANNSNLEVELQKAAKEVQQLREEESILRGENLRLKEELLRLKWANSQDGATASMAAPNKYIPAVQDQQMVLIRIGFSVVLAIIGIILGKYVL